MIPRAPSSWQTITADLALILFLVLALLSHSPRDAAWSTSGAGGPVHNWAGVGVEDLPNLRRWMRDVRLRPGVARGMDVPKSKKETKEEAAERGSKLLV